MVRSRPNTVSAYLVVNGLPVCACWTTMPRSNSPETTRMNARRSRCAASMPACTLNTTAENGSEVSRGAPVTVGQARGGGASSTSASRIWWTPKLSIAEAKITGLVSPARYSSWSWSWPIADSSSDSSTAVSHTSPSRSAAAAGS